MSHNKINAITAAMTTLFLFTQALTAQRDARFTRFSQKDGLSQNQIQSLVTDEWGFLWIGTSGGLNRYDGNTFRCFFANPDDPGSLTGNNCFSLCYDSSRKGLWIGTNGAGLNFLSCLKYQFSSVQLSAPRTNKTGNEEVLALLLDQKNHLWIGGSCGLQRLAPESRNPTPIPLRDPNDPDTIPGYVTSLARDSNNRLFLGTDRGLWQMTDKAPPFRMVLPWEDRGAQRIWTVLCDRHDHIWVGTEEKGLLELSPTGTVLRRFNTFFDRNFSADAINTLAEDSTKRLWIGTYGEGLIRLPINHPANPLPQELGAAPFKLPGGFINCIYLHPPRLLWIGTDQGLYRYDPNQEKIGHAPRRQWDDSSSGGTDVSTLIQVGASELWLGTSDRGILKMSLPPSSNGLLVSNQEDEILLKGQTLIKMILDSNGYIWAASTDGLTKMNRKGRILKQFIPGGDRSESILSKSLVTLCEDMDRRIWIGSNDRGVCVYSSDTEVFTQLSRKTVPSLSIWAFFADADHSMWIGTRDGLFQVDPHFTLKKSFIHDKSASGSLSSNWVFTVLRDSRNRLWVGTAGGGLCCLDEQNGRFQRFDRRHGLPDDDILNILEDRNNCLWISTNRGICSFNPENHRTRIFTSNHGFSLDEFNLDCAIRLADGRLVFGSAVGIDFFDPGTLLTPEKPVPLRLTDLFVNNRLQKISPPLFQRERIELPYQRSIISFEFAALDFCNAENLHYRYRLKGWQNQWIQTGQDNRRASFSQLSPGQYTLEVQAMNPNQTRASDIQRVTVTIPAPFWKRSWFFVLMGTLFSLGSYFFIHFMSAYLNFRRFWRRNNHIGCYTLESRIGSGGMADVYSAREVQKPHRKVAIKILREELKTDPVSQLRFRQEAAIADQLIHPNIVRVFERGSQDERPYIVMEHLDGITLSYWIRRQGGSSPREIAPIVIQICLALEKIHRKGITHRDLKPANIMVLTHPRRDIQIKLLDFGLARIPQHSRLTRTGTVMGTLSYMAPETLNGCHTGPSSDVYSLGVMVFELLTGTLPYSGGSTGDVLNQILLEVPPLLSEMGVRVHAEVEMILDRMLDKRPSARPSTAEIAAAFSRRC